MIMNGDDITYINENLPRFERWFPEKTKWWQKILCLIGRHKWETRQSAKGHCYGFETEEGKRKKRFGLHDESPLKLRDQCAWCDSLR